MRHSIATALAEYKSGDYRALAAMLVEDPTLLHVRNDLLGTLVSALQRGDTRLFDAIILRLSSAQEATHA